MTPERLDEIEQHGCDGEEDFTDLIAAARREAALRDVVVAADDLSKHLRSWVLSGLNAEDWPLVQAAGIRYEKARAEVPQ